MYIDSDPDCARATFNFGAAAFTRQYDIKVIISIQARIIQLVANQLSTEEVPGSNPSKSENFSMNINN